MSLAPGRGEGLARWLLAAAVAGMAGYTALHFDATADITHLLPSATDQRLAATARQLADSELSRTMILLVAGQDADQARKGAAALGAALAQDPEVSWIQTGPAAELGPRFYELYFPHRLGLMSEKPEAELPGRLADAGLDTAAQRLKTQLAMPTAALIKKVAPADPLLAFPDWLERLEAMQPAGLSVVQGHFMARDGKQAVIFLGTVHSAMDYAHQAAFLQRLDQHAATVRGAIAGSLRVARSGVNRHAVAARERIEADIQRISIVSVAAIVLLFAVLFRSIGLLAIGLLPLAVGVLAGLSATLLVAGRIHGLTLTFGATLIGVCLDYPVHLFNHHSLDRESGGAMASLRRVWPGLFLGALTTITGFAGLALSSLPALREIAFFAIAGIIAALATTRLWVVPLLPKNPPTVAAQQRAAQGLATALRWLAQRRLLVWSLPVAALMVAAVGLPAITWTDEVAALTRQDAALADEDDAVRAQVSAHESGRMVVVTAPTLEAALAVNDRVALRLEQAKEAGVLGQYRSLHTLLWSAGLQRRNLAVLQAAPQLAERTTAALQRAGFRGHLFAPFGEALADPPPPLSWQQLADSELAPLVRPFRVHIGEEVGLLTFVSEVHDPKALAAAVQVEAGALFFDQKAFMNSALGRHRQGALWLVILGLLAVVAVVGLRYRDTRRAALAVVPALLAGGFTFGALALLGEPLHLLHLVSGVLMLSMGVDYGVFLAEGLDHARGPAATLLSIVIACLSTVLAFGLLGLSANPALRAIGLTTGIGVLASLVLAPAVMLLTRPKPAAPSVEQESG